LQDKYFYTLGAEVIGSPSNLEKSRVAVNQIFCQKKMASAVLISLK
jgi:hypothetical protein